MTTLRKNSLVQLSDDTYAKTVRINRKNKQVKSVLIRTLDNNLIDVLDLTKIKSITKLDMDFDVYQRLNNIDTTLTEDEKLDRVWQRRDEAQKTFMDDKTFAPVQRLDVKIMRKIANEEETTLDKFLEYARKRKLSEKPEHADLDFEDFNERYQYLRIVRGVEQRYEMTNIFDFSKDKPVGKRIDDNLQNVQATLYQLIDRQMDKVLIETTENADINDYVRNVLNITVHR